MQTVLIVIHIMIVVALVVTVLLQRSEGGALGVGGGGGFMTGRGQANALTRATAILGTLFFVTSLSLTMLAKFTHGPSTIVNTPPAQTAPAAPEPQPQGGGLLDQLRQMENQRQSAPPAGR